MLVPVVTPTTHPEPSEHASPPPLCLLSSAQGVSLENGTCIRPTVTLIAYYLPIRHVWVQQRPSYQQGRYDAQYSAYPSTHATDVGTLEVYQQCFSKEKYIVYSKIGK